MKLRVSEIEAPFGCLSQHHLETARITFARLCHEIPEYAPLHTK